MNRATRTAGSGPDDRPDVGNELHQPVEAPEEQRVVLAIGKDAEHAEDPQRQRGARAHDQAEQQLAADVAEHRMLDEQLEVVLGRPVSGRHDPPDQAPISSPYTSK